VNDKKKLPIDVNTFGRSVAKHIKKSQKKSKQADEKFPRGEGIDESCKWDDRGDKHL